MAKPPKSIRIHGRRYRMEWAPKKMNPGLGGALIWPLAKTKVRGRKPRPIMLITKDIAPRMILRAIVHDCLHACDMKKSERWVDRSSKDIARVLWRHGFRRSKSA